MSFRFAELEGLTKEQALDEARKRYRRMLLRSSPGGLALELALLQIRYGVMEDLVGELTKRLPRQLPPGDPRLILHELPSRMFHYWLEQDLAWIMADFERGHETLELALPLLKVAAAYGQVDFFPEFLPYPLKVFRDKLKLRLEADRRRAWVARLAELVNERTGRYLDPERLGIVLQDMDIHPRFEEDELQFLAGQVTDYLPFV